MSNKDLKGNEYNVFDRQFKRQAQWTKGFRNNIYRQIGLLNEKRILEVGCGTGVITREIRRKCSAKITAIDSDSLMIEKAKTEVENVNFLVESAASMTAKSASYDIVFSHYFFLWLPKPSDVLHEMVRVCKKGGYVIALAEPDYGGWIENPELRLGKYHVESLKEQGANPFIGRQLLDLFQSANLETSISVVAQTWSRKHLTENIEEEWRRVLETSKISEKEFTDIIKKEKELIKKNIRMIFIPIFTAVGRKL